jgi:hypothetical protein
VHFERVLAADCGDDKVRKSYRLSAWTPF